MFGRIGLCVSLITFFFQANEIVGFGGLNFYFLIILRELIVQCVITIYIQGFSTFLVHFVGLAYQGKDIVFRFIIEYSSLRDFGL
jgi:hypothetical protein